MIDDDTLAAGPPTAAFEPLAEVNPVGGLTAASHGEERRLRVRQLRAQETAALSVLDEAREGLIALGELPVEGERDEGRFLNAREAADFVGCHANTIYQAAQAGDLSCHRVGRNRRFTRLDLREWMRANS